MILEKISSKYIKEITIKNLRKKYFKNPVQRILVDYFLRKESICSDGGNLVYRGNVLLYINKECKEKITLDKEKIIKELEKEKHFLIDLSLYNLHTRKGRKSLEIQVSQSLKEIRDFLYDSNLILVGDIDFSFLGRNEVKICKRREDFPFYKYKPLILDPYADENLTEKDIKKYNLFLLGGIVDVGQRWERATEYLFRDLDIERRKIILGDNIKGVPDRINIIVRIILQVYYFGLELRDAIIINQKKKDILERLFYEIKLVRSGKREIKDIFWYLNVDKEMLRKIIKKYNIKINFDIIWKYSY